MNWHRKYRAALALSTASMVALTGLATTQASADEAPQDVVLSTDFSEHPVGKGVPEGWTELFATSFYEIADHPSRLVKTSIGDNRHLLAWEDIGVVEGDVEVATLLRQPETTRPELTTTRFQVHVHASGAAGAINSYSVDDRGIDNGGVRLRRSLDHSQSTLGSNANEPFTTQVWHNVVLQRRGDTVRTKIWPYFTEEPDEWTVEATDTNLDSGWVGVGYFGDRMTQEFAWFSVGTGGQDAERAPAGIEGIPEPQVPVAPVIAGTPEDRATVVDWEPVPGADHYEIERDGELIAHGWENSSYADPTIEPGTAGTYRVRGISVLAGEGDWSEPVDVTATSLPADHLLTFETEADAPWTMEAEELAFLDALAADSPRMSYEQIGESGEGRPVHLVRIGRDAPPDDDEIANRPTALITGGNHGNEVAGRQGVLFLLRNLATSNDPEVLDWLDTYAILIIPTINPDGVAANTRNLVIPNIDPNRDFVALTSKETRNVLRVVRDYRPVVIADAHEWAASAGHQRGEMETGPPGNANAHPDLLALSGELGFDRVIPEGNDSAGWRTSRYQEQYGQPSRFRQIGALKHALTYLTESSRHPEVRRLDEANLSQDHHGTNRRRVASQDFALNTFMRFATENVDAITAASEASIKRHESNPSPLYTDGSVDFPPTAEQTLDPTPCGWILDDVDSVADVLDVHGIAWEQRRIPGGQLVNLVPARQEARGVAVAALDPASPERLEVSALRVDDTGWCRRGKPNKD
jgi:hypothetical protein